ncbi:hypothetical protein BBH99_00270 [Chryseobacterium contaminans]|uniref:Predicted NTP pyrophosphohydrolase, NUDIX family n=1 Tax=Chryseobacterium contaminans TaxID=1423959 RepID=A0A1M6VN16_9FLAO|nr:NUDIX domain-containing protein [Chryseobacterium contaminans]OCA80572.1 hypothetical protein BBH99_00270 [Chryseobacterium contaminans]SHK82890.1 Predicted NTP pyrophosphohydrolase, NUDIX family [Chryseobacterium contaminans]
MIKSAGILIIKSNKILLVKPKNINSDNNWSIPKGIIDEENDKNIIFTAIRETFEETGILIPYNKIDLSRRSIISYVDSKGLLTKVIFYFIVEISENEYAHYKSGHLIDSNEIETFDFFSFREARNKIYWKQYSVLNFLKPSSFCLNELELLLSLGYIYKVKHPIFPLWLYNITRKCKLYKNWNYTTLSCRGLILDDSGKIIARPFKKFFEKKDIYPEILDVLPISNRKRNKLDGGLGIMYKYKNYYHLCSKNNFNHYIGTIATDYFYNSLFHLNFDFCDNHSYLFEIISNKASFTINYEITNSIFPIGAVNKQTSNNNFKLLDLVKTEDITGLTSEGYVEFYEDGTMIKYKEENFEKEYNNFKASKNECFFDNNDKTTDNLLSRKKILDHKSNNVLTNLTIFFNTESRYVEEIRFWI